MQYSASYSGRVTKSTPNFKTFYEKPDVAKDSGGIHTKAKTEPLTINYKPSLNYLEVSWQSPVNNHEYREYIRFIGLCIAMLRIEYIMVDFSKFGEPGLVDQISTAEFLQKALLKTTLKRSARLLSGEDSQLQAHQQLVKNGPKLPYQVQVFLDSTDAVKWLFDGADQSASAKNISIPLSASLRDLRAFTAQKSSYPVSAQSLASEKTKSILIFRTNFVEIITDKERSLLVLRWFRNVTSREYRYGVLKAARAMLDNQVNFLLLNNQRMGVLTMEDQAWFVSNSVAILAKSKLERLAMINSADAMQQITFERMEARIKKNNLTYTCCLFLSEAEAIGWLLTPEAA